MKQGNLFKEDPDIIGEKQPKLKEKEITRDAELELLGAKIIETKRLDVFPAKIAYLSIYPNISKTCASKIIKSNPELKMFSGYDYIIEISGDLREHLDEQNLKVLLEHQLRHILVVQDEKSGIWKFKLKRHDIEEFSRINKDYGYNWIATVKMCLSSMYDLSPAEEDNITI